MAAMVKCWHCLPMSAHHTPDTGTEEDKALSGLFCKLKAPGRARFPPAVGTKRSRMRGTVHPEVSTTAQMWGPSVPRWTAWALLLQSMHCIVSVSLQPDWKLLPDVSLNIYTFYNLKAHFWWIRAFICTEEENKVSQKCKFSGLMNHKSLVHLTNEATS